MDDHQRQAWRDSLEQRKTDLEAWKPAFDAAMRYAELAIRSLLLVAGGAAVALAGFAGNSIGTATAPVREALASSIWWFGIAAAGAVATAALAYASQIVFIEAPRTWSYYVGASVRWLALSVFVGSLWCVVRGAATASLALRLAGH